MELYRISLASSLLIVFILVLRKIAVYKLPRKTFAILWMIVLLRLLIPVTIKLPVPEFLVSVKDKLKLTENALITSAVTKGMEGSVNSGEIIAKKSAIGIVVFSIWMAVTGVLFLLFMINYMRSRKHVNEAMPSNNDYARRWLRHQRIRRKVRLLSFDRITSPVTVGVLSPRIILPKTMEADRGKRLNYVLFHEMIHIRRFDIVWKLLSMIAVCIHWYNPFVWIMYKQFNKDIETACDEGVIEVFGNEAKPDYAYAIIQLMEKKPQAAFLYNGFGEKPVEERIVSIMKLGKKTKTSMTVSITVIMMSLIVFINTVALGAMDDSQFVIKLGSFNEGEIVDGHPKNLEARSYYPVNENGYTYGKASQQINILPDLIYVESINGEEGYAYANEIWGYESLNLMKQGADNNRDSDFDGQKMDKICNVYKYDGETIIGTYKIK